MIPRLNFHYGLCLIVTATLFTLNENTTEQPGTVNVKEEIQVESGFVDVVGGRLFYERAGQGEPVILLHDGLLHRETWDEQFQAFSGNFSVIRYDRRGYGRSTRPRAFYSNVEDLHVLFATLKIERAVLIGLSSGAGLAIDFAISYPGKVSALVLVGPVVSGLGFTDHFLDRGGHLRESDREDKDVYRQYWFKRDPYIIAPENGEARKKARQLLEAHPHNLDPANYRLLRKTGRQAVEALGEIKVPTLILVGEHDIPDVHAHAGAIEAGINGSRRIIIRRAGHLVPLEQPDVFNEVVGKFLEGVDSFQSQ